MRHRRYIIPIRPRVAWYVEGRKLFAPFPPRIKAMWKVGRYAATRPRDEGERE